MWRQFSTTDKSPPSQTIQMTWSLLHTTTSFKWMKTVYAPRSVQKAGHAGSEEMGTSRVSTFRWCWSVKSRTARSGISLLMSWCLQSIEQHHVSHGWWGTYWHNARLQRLGKGCLCLDKDQQAGGGRSVKYFLILSLILEAASPWRTFVFATRSDVYLHAQYERVLEWTQTFFGRRRK